MTDHARNDTRTTVIRHVIAALIVLLAVGGLPVTPSWSQSLPIVELPTTRDESKPRAAAAFGRDPSDHIVEVSHSLTLVVENANAWIDAATEKEPRSSTDLRLYLNNLEMPGVELVGIRQPDPKKDVVEVRFRLTRTTDNAQRWTQLLTDPNPHLQVSTGPAGGPAFMSSASVQLSAMTSSRQLWVYGGLLGLGIAILLAGLKTNLLRDDEPSAVTGRYRFSLGRIQAALWFMIVLGTFAFLYLVWKTPFLFNMSSLGLLGISVGTAIGAVSIDANKAAAATAAQPPPVAAAAPVAVVVPPVAGKRNLMAELAHLPEDLLHDRNGLSFHRVQLLAWTLVLASIFIAEAWRTLAMPDFSSEMLLLMGISAGTFVLLKYPEKRD